MEGLKDGKLVTLNACSKESLQPGTFTEIKR